MSECPKAECIQAGRIASLETSQARDQRDFAELKSWAKDIHTSAVGNGRKGLKSRVQRNSIYLYLIGAAIVLIPSLIAAYAALAK